MGPVEDLKSRTIEASTSKGHVAFVSMPKDNNIKPESKQEGKFDVGVCKNEYTKVDIMNCTNDEEASSVQPQSDDATASSSSFGNTFSDVGTCEYESDNEVMSDLRGDLFPLRKKRVTSHWRKFVQPIMWRCKWVELQLRKFQSLAIKYDKEIEKHNHTKQLKYKKSESQNGCAKSMPFFHDSQREKHMNRKIRKRHDEVDTDVYMSQHNLFSYFATCMSPTHGPTMDDDQNDLAPSCPKNVSNEFRVPDELLSLDFRDDYSLEQILWKIEVSQSQVSEMKTRLNTLMIDNEERIASTEDLILQESINALTCPVKESVFPTDMEGQSVAKFASQLMKLNTGDALVSPDDLVKPDNLVKPENAGLGQDAKETMEQPSLASRKRNTDGILIYNRRAKKAQTDSGAVKIHPIEKLQIPKEEKSNNAAPISVSEDSSQNELPAPKLRSVSKLNVPKNKKKRAVRARRKSGSSLWTRRTSG